MNSTAPHHAADDQPQHPEHAADDATACGRNQQQIEPAAPGRALIGPISRMHVAVPASCQHRSRHMLATRNGPELSSGPATRHVMRGSASPW
jgi:hypothetical protein